MTQTGKLASVGVGLLLHFGGRPFGDFDLRQVIERVERIEANGDRRELGVLGRPDELLIDGREADRQQRHDDELLTARVLWEQSHTISPKG